MFKVTFDLRKTGWQSFGRVVFVDAEDQAIPAAQRCAGADATLENVVVRPAMPGEHERFLKRVAAYEEWLRNSGSGIPNKRGQL